MDLAAHNIAYYLYLNKLRQDHLFKIFHFASDGHYEEMMNEHFEYLSINDDLKDVLKMMSFEEQFILLKIIN